MIGIIMIGNYLVVTPYFHLPMDNYAWMHKILTYPSLLVLGFSSFFCVEFSPRKYLFKFLFSFLTESYMDIMPNI